MKHFRVLVSCTRAVVMLALLSFAAPSNAQIKFVFGGCLTPGPGASVTTGDFNRDGKPDLAVSSSGIQICMNQGSGKFLNTSTLSGGPSFLLAADLNKDGKLDLIGAEGPVLAEFFGHGDGTFSSPRTLPLSNDALEFVLGDFDRNGTIDVIALECATTGTCKVNEYLNSGSGAFPTKRQVIGSRSDIGACGTHLLLAADFNLDGKLDLVVCRTTSSLILFGHGDGSFGTPISILPHSNLALGSFNHDRYLDIVGTINPPCPDGPPCASYAGVYLNNGSGQFGLRSRTLMLGDQVVTDVNGDGIADLVSHRGGVFDAGFDYALGHGDGTFSSEVNIGADTAPFLPIARDVNLDGRHDLIYTTAIDGGAVVLLNTNASVICAPPNAASIHAKICAPLPDAVVSKSFTVKASGNSPAGVQRLELWVDGKKRSETANDQMKSTLSVATGAHRVAVVAVDLYGARTVKAIQVRAQ